MNVVFYFYIKYFPFLSTCNDVINVDTHPCSLMLTKPHRVLRGTSVRAAEINLSSTLTIVLTTHA